MRALPGCCQAQTNQDARWCADNAGMFASDTVLGMTTTAVTTSRWVKLRELAVMLDISETTASRYAATVGFPAAAQWVEGGVLRWERLEVEAWMKARARRPQRLDPSAPAVVDRRRGPKPRASAA
jgi:predicted DNA-binding transcriptional regulator AlpA